MPAPILVLGIGNELLGDDGVGIALMKLLAERFADKSSHVEFVDGGTQGLALLGLLDNRKAILILDAISLGKEPGTVHILNANQVTSHPQDIPTAHGSSARELLNAAILIGQLTPDVTVVGIEPAEVRTRVGLSATVEASLDKACEKASKMLGQLISQ